MGYTIPGQRYFHGDTFYTDWFPRQGDSAIFRAECVDLVVSSTANLTVSFFTKNSDETGNGGEIVGSTLDFSEVDKGEIKTLMIDSSSSAGLEELVRCKVVVDQGTDGDWFLIRMFAPAFFDTADGTQT